MPSNIVRNPARPDDAFKAQQKLEFDRWRTAIAIVERMREAGNMRGLVAAVLSIAFGIVALGIPAQEARSIDRLAKRATNTLPMNFILRYEAPAENCGAKCRLLVVATGFITAETPRQFALFADWGDCGAQLRRWFGRWGHRFGSCNPATRARHYCRPSDRPQRGTGGYCSS